MKTSRNKGTVGGHVRDPDLRNRSVAVEARPEASSTEAAPTAPPTADGPILPHELDRLFRDLTGTTGICIAVSGGSDSMALLHLLHVWRRRQSTPPPLLAVTVDHGLRAESAEEARWVGAQAATMAVEHKTVCWTGPKPQSGLQDAARAARYRLLFDAARRAGCTAIVTAHTQDDQAETLLMRLARGSGVDGLSGMQTRTMIEGIAVVRPLLAVSKARLTATVQAAGISWQEDPSNGDPRFERVRIRLAGVAREALGLTLPQLARSGRRLSRARLALDQWTLDFLRHQVELHEGAGACLAEGAFRQIPDEIALRALRRLLWAFGGQAGPPRLVRVENLLAGLHAGQVAATLGGCEIVRDAGRVTVFRESGRQGLAVLPVTPGLPLVWDRRFRILVTGPLAHAHERLQVRPLGTAGMRALALLTPTSPPAGRSGPQFAWQAFKSSLNALPRRALSTLPSVWNEARLVAVPAMGRQQPDLSRELPWQAYSEQDFMGTERLWSAAMGELGVS